jgi:hypothetical protein
MIYAPQRAKGFKSSHEVQGSQTILLRDPPIEVSFELRPTIRVEWWKTYTDQRISKTY